MTAGNQTSLLPCPFCDASDLLAIEPTTAGGWLAVMCRTCGCHASRPLTTVAQAAVNWNSRADTAPRRPPHLADREANVPRICRMCRGIGKLRSERSINEEVPIGHEPPRLLLTLKDASTIVQTILAMSRALGITVTAEGVETKEQLEFLRVHGCDQAQGYLFSRPIAAADVPGVIDAINASQGLQA